MKKHNHIHTSPGLLMTMVPPCNNSRFEGNAPCPKNDGSKEKFGNLKIHFYF
jgi:hypothetical protein